ncbi:MAG: YvcK family protein [Patescibacteria group bacterium]|nr:YvcK family protein [Patescibacteria group bacterium]
MAKKKRKSVVVIGAGAGTFTVLSGLKKYHADLTAIVAMTDSGGSTGMLRDELGVLPPGDVARCLVALSTSDKLMRTLMDYRFDNGNLKDHRFGNLLLSALEKTTGSFERAVERVGDILRIEGRVIPSTLDKVHLMAKVGKRIIRSEEKIQMTKMNGSLERLWLEPVARANPKALQAIREADGIVIGPGGFYTGIVTNLLVRGIPEAIRKSKAKKMFVCNLMTKMEHTRNYSVADYTAAVEKFLGGAVDAVVYNNRKPSARLLKRYAREGDSPTSWSSLPEGPELVGANFLSERETTFQKIGTPSKEASLVRHDPARLAAAIAKLVGVKKKKKPVAR